jgi:Domain of unknown function (DUF397)
MEHINGPAWRKSSHSGGNGGACVEVAARDGMILVRDTKDRGRGPVQRYAPAAWKAFVAGLRDQDSAAGGPGRLL